MGLRLLGLWTVLLSLSAAKDAFKSCDPPSIPNGFFISEQNAFSHDSELYYGCDYKYRPVEGSWWASVTCQDGNWSSLPQCIENDACLYPEIPNENKTALQYVKNELKIWIKCNFGYEDDKRHATARCKNGSWTELPACNRMASSCGPPAPIPNGIIINQDHQDVFPEGTRLEYVCRSGFELETNRNETFCSYDHWIPTPSCRPKETTQERVPVPQATGHPMVTRSKGVHRCNTAPPFITNGERYFDENSMTATYRCSHYYKLKGDNMVRCENGQWTRAPSCQEDFCRLDTSKYPALEDAGFVYLKSGTETMLACKNTKEAHAECIDKKLYLTQCCRYRHTFNMCPYAE